MGAVGRAEGVVHVDVGQGGELLKLLGIIDHCLSHTPAIAQGEKVDAAQPAQAEEPALEPYPLADVMC
jgi:hypothetical protein